jgi:cobaltochelatase CobN
MREKNPAAAAAIAARLREALDRGLWVTRRNSVAAELERAGA